MFISNYYDTPTPTPPQGRVAYAPSSPQSGFKVAAGLKSLESEAIFILKYTWFNNNAATGNFSFPESTGYLTEARTLTRTSEMVSQGEQLNYKVHIRGLIWS